MTWRQRSQGWSFTTRLVALALVPALLMFVAVNVSLYLMSLDEAKADVQERGRIVAAALSEGSRYGVISGIVESVERTVRGLIQADRSIAAIEVLDANRRALVAIRGSESAPGTLITELPITAGSIDVDLLDANSGGPNLSQGRSEQGRAPVGYVRVAVSPAPLLEARQLRLVQGSGLFVLAALASAAVGLVLARRMRRPLSEVMAALRKIRQGRFDINVERTASGELGELQSAIAEMAKGLGLTRQQLEDEVARRTLELQEAIRVARAADDERRRLIARGNDLVEDERRRLSLEIHDELNAALVSVRLQANALAARAADDDQSETQQAADRIAEMTDDLYRRARAIVTQLRPEVIDTLGLAGAIEEMVRKFDEVDDRCQFELHIVAQLPLIPEPVAIAAYRVVQEALSNVAKHAQASRCEVTLEHVRSTEHHALRLKIADNGKGYDPADGSSLGIGLIGMRERVAALAGSLAVTSLPAAGTTIAVELPLRSPTHPEASVPVAGS